MGNYELHKCVFINYISRILLHTSSYNLFPCYVCWTHFAETECSSFSLLYSILLQDYFTVDSSILLLMGIWVASNLGLLLTALLGTLVPECLLVELVHVFFLSINQSF